MYSPEPSVIFSIILIIRGHLLQITPFKHNLPDKESGMLARSNAQLNPNDSRKPVSIVLSKTLKMSDHEEDKWWLSKFKAEHMKCSTEVNTSLWIMYWPCPVVHILAYSFPTTLPESSKQALGRIDSYKIQKEGVFFFYRWSVSITSQCFPITLFRLQRFYCLLLIVALNTQLTLSIILFLFRCTEFITAWIHYHQNCK